MALTFGFYDSLGGDRKYNAKQMASIFDGIIQDGIYQSIGQAFVVKAVSGTQISVGTGRAWFNHTWTLNDAVLMVTAPLSNILLPRYDEVVIEVNTDSSVRANSIKIVQGTASSTPQRPTLQKTGPIYQYSLATIYRPANTDEITQAKITNRVGLLETPFVMGVLKSISIDDLVAQWSSQWGAWFEKHSTEGNTQMDIFLSEQQSEFNVWFANLQTILEGDAAANMANRLDRLESHIRTLTQEQRIYQSIQDSNGESILDSSSDSLSGQIVYVIK